MATRAVLTPGSAELPASNYPQFTTANAHPLLAFDAATDETAYWTLIAPQGITGQLDCIITYIMASATSGAVRWEVLVEAVTDGDSTDIDAGDSFDSTNSAGATVPGTAGFIDQITVTLTNKDSIAAGDLVRILIRRDANGTTGTDDAAGDAYLVCAEIRDAA